MEKSNEDACSILDNRLQNLIQTLTTCKKEYFNVKEECKSLKEINTKLETELKEARELEKSHRYHLATSREMIANLQDTVSKLVYLKRDTKKLKDELLSKDYTIAALEKEKTTILQMQDENISEMRNEHDKQIEDLKLDKEKKILQKQYECDTQIAQLTCTIEELRNQTKEMEAKSMEKMNVVVLEYEEKIQRGAAHIAQLQEQLAHQAARTDSSIDTYKRRLEDLEEKLKQSQFKQYLASSLYPTQYENTVERPYSANRDPYPSCSIDLDTNLEVKKPYYPALSQNKTQKLNKLQVLDPNVKADKKGSFTITKKRKLYNEKDFSAF